MQTKKNKLKTNLKVKKRKKKRGRGEGYGERVPGEPSFLPFHLQLVKSQGLRGRGGKALGIFPALWGFCKKQGLTSHTQLHDRCLQHLHGD